ncbi:lysosomal phospholipase A and acyltransferase-like [Littorina saxatilis]|uniref:Uncharacterized protein n=1 Tax=Littorina saxatilis TaxID=31220 RepID=A0AAN9GNA9_9CAEN
MMPFLLALFVLGCSVIHCGGVSKHPVILVPGLGASQLWHKKGKEPFYRSLWVYPHKTIFKLDSLVEDMKLNVNSSTGSTFDDRGHTVKACGFGNPKSLTGLVTSWNPFANPYPKMTSSDCDGEEFYEDDSDFDGMNKTFLKMLHNKKGANHVGHWLGAGLSLFDFCGSKIKDYAKKIAGIKNTWKNVHYFKDLIHTLEKKGYRANVDIKGAPYDFRKAPNELTEYYRSLKRLIEDTFSKNGNSKVVLVAHSNGNPVLLYFYNSVVTAEWKDKYIRAHVALGPPWAGATKTVKLMVSGDSVNIPFVKGKRLRPMQRSWPTVAWLMPSPSHGLWKEGEPLIKVDHYSYGVGDYRHLFDDLGYPDGYRLWQTVEREAVADLSKPPEVRELHVFYGINVPTAGHFVYTRTSFPDSDPKTVDERDGDGTVNRRSLEAFKKFRSSKFTNITHHAYPGKDHMDVLRDQRVLSFITNLVFSKEPALPPRHEKSRFPNAASCCGSGWQVPMLTVMVLGLVSTV